MSFGDSFCSRKGEIGGDGWMYPKGVNSMATSGLVCRNDLVGTGKAFKACVLAMVGWHFSRVLIGSLLIGGYG